jgi:hypothetical protein
MPFCCQIKLQKFFSNAIRSFLGKKAHELAKIICDKTTEQQYLENLHHSTLQEFQQEPIIPEITREATRESSK